MDLKQTLWREDKQLIWSECITSSIMRFNYEVKYIWPIAYPYLFSFILFYFIFTFNDVFLNYLINLGAKLYHTLHVSSSLNDVGAVQTSLYMHRYSKFIVAMPTPVLSKAIKLCTVSIVSYLHSFNKETMRPLAVLWSTVYLPSLNKILVSQ